MRTSNHWVVGAALAALVAGTGACAGASGAPSPSAAASSATDQATPSVTAPSSPTASSATGTSRPPDIPAAARAATKEGAQQFVGYWMEQFNRSVQVPDERLVAVLSSPDCPACSRFIVETKALPDNDQRVQGDMWTITGSYTESFNVSSTIVIAVVQQHPVARVDSSEAVIGRYEKKVFDLALTLAHNGSAWRLERLQVAQ